MRPSSEWMDDRLEAYVDGDLPDDEQLAFEAALRADPAWQMEVDQAQQVRDVLGRLPQPACPPEVTGAVMAEVQRRVRHARRQRWRVWLDEWLATAYGLARPVLAATVLVGLVVTAARIGGPSAPSLEQQQYTQAEVERAAVQVRWALGYVAHVGETTGTVVQEEVLREHVARPMRHALGDVLYGEARL